MIKVDVEKADRDTLIDALAYDTSPTEGTRIINDLRAYYNLLPTEVLRDKAREVVDLTMPERGETITALEERRREILSSRAVKRSRTVTPKIVKTTLNRPDKTLLLIAELMRRHWVVDVVELLPGEMIGVSCPFEMRSRVKDICAREGYEGIITFKEA